MDGLHMYHAMKAICHITIKEKVQHTIGSSVLPDLYLRFLSQQCGFTQQMG